MSVDICYNISRTFGIILSIAFIFTSIGLLISGYICNPSWAINKDTCLNMYISGIFMTFILGVIMVFNLLICLVERMDTVPVVQVNNPVVKKKPVKNSPLRSVVTQD
jgi:hypothetical protein